jgi:hypothetical protein
MICIRFIADRSVLSRAIRSRTDGQASHVEYVLPEHRVTFGARLEGGITHRPLDYCKPTWEEWYTFPGIEASYWEAVEFSGRKYDWKDIAALAVSWHSSFYDPERAICSCLVGYSNRLAYARGKAPLLLNLNLPTWQMTPQLLYGAVTDPVLMTR